MDSTAYGGLFTGGSDGAVLAPLWRGASLAGPEHGIEPVMVDLLTAFRVLSEPETAAVMGGRCPCCDSPYRAQPKALDDGDGAWWCDDEWHAELDGPFAGWLMVPPPTELRTQPWLLLSPLGHAAIRLDEAETLTSRWLANGSEER